ncbi:MAG TPA: pyruvate, phosphate dikinase [Alphaproteobacteria bacterium]|nr:pyruvate, phosphate dikinase [Alphaproteobacteria bacterium]
MTQVLTKWVYPFGSGHADGSAEMLDLLGGKGANLAEMSKLGLPVPPGFTITTEVCSVFYENDHNYPIELHGQVAQALADVETLVDATFGDKKNPLLVSVRSGAQASMPGMMDTVLNLGLNDETVEGLARKSDDERFAYDSYRRFIQMYGDVVLGVAHHHFEDILENYKDERDYRLDTEMVAEDWREITCRYRKEIICEHGKAFPQDPKIQLWGAIGAVFGSWMNQRAVTYRRLHDIPESWGTAVNVQAMVFGNMGDDCATGVAFTRNPSNGLKQIYGEYLVNAQGEDVVAGIRTPQPLTLAGKQSGGVDSLAMEEAMPAVFDKLKGVCDSLEFHYCDMQDIEFTVQKGQLWMLQTRNGKRTAQAALQIAVDMAREKVIDEREAVTRVDPVSLEQLLHPTLDPAAPRTVLARGLAASPGAATGVVVFDADEAERRAHGGDDVLLVRIETSPEDIHGMHAACGILTARGGMTSHAAVVARGMGRPCVSGASDVRIDYGAGTLAAGGRTVFAGDVITIDGSTGEIMVGRVPMVEPELGEEFTILMTWADKYRILKVRANAETPEDARIAREFGAEGIGLCRTEHMFFEGARITAMREMIMAEGEVDRRAAMAKVLPMQRQDFVELFKIMAGMPVTIRLLDPPLHEFLPKMESEYAELAEATGSDPNKIRHRAAQLHEVNPMLGHRGCRLGITHPEIYEMQARAIFEAAILVGRELGKTVKPEVMIPLVATRTEFDLLRGRIDKIAEDVKEDLNAELSYLVGTMIELPRACLCADSLAESAEFFSFGTNDLTQTTFGISRDDSAHFLPIYEEQDIISKDPFVSIDVNGVGELIRIAAERGRSTRLDIKLGICGEHGGDPSSIAFCQRIGLEYVSCSSYRVPIARLAAAQAAIGKLAESD